MTTSANFRKFHWLIMVRNCLIVITHFNGWHRRCTANICLNRCIKFISLCSPINFSQYFTSIDVAFFCSFSIVLFTFILHIFVLNLWMQWIIYLAGVWGSVCIPINTNRATVPRLHLAAAAQWHKFQLENAFMSTVSRLMTPPETWQEKGTAETETETIPKRNGAY